MENPIELKFNTIQVRYILRESNDGKVKLIEDVNGDYSVILNNKIIGTYIDKNLAIKCYGTTTRNLNE